MVALCFILEQWRLFFVGHSETTTAFSRSHLGLPCCSIVNLVACFVEVVLHVEGFVSSERL